MTLAELLRDELALRKVANDKYSMRAFAKSLRLEPSYLSKIMRAQRTPTPQIIERVGLRLNLTSQEIHKLQETYTKSSKHKSRTKYEYLTHDQVEILSNWYYMPILELIHLKDFNPSSEWVARKLSISPKEANEALQRLERVEYIKKTSAGDWKLASANTSTIKSAATTEALRRAQTQALQRAIKSLQDVPVEFRDQSSLTMALPVSEIENFKKYIKKFRRKMTKEWGKISTPKDCVYQLTISLVPLTSLKGEG